MASLDGTAAPEPLVTTVDPFKSHLVALLSIYELGPFPGAPIPRYEGPSDWQTETILRSLSAFARRMWSAEEVAVSYKPVNGQEVRIHRDLAASRSADVP